MVRDARTVGMEADGMVTANIEVVSLRRMAEDTIGHLNVLQGLFAVMEAQFVAYPNSQDRMRKCFDELNVYKKRIAEICDISVELLRSIDELERNK